MNYDPLMIGNCIRDLRKEQRLTQEDLAERLNTHQSTISNLENGHMENIHVTLFLDLFKELKLSINDVFKPETEILTNDNLTTSLLYYWGKLSINDQKNILRIITGLVELNAKS